MILDRYVALRDDAGPRSVSLNERNFLRKGPTATRALRVDGRRHCDVRNVRLELGRWDNGSKCTVQWGIGTRVTALCCAELVPPSPDHPSEGMVDFSVDLSPMAGTSFRQANPVGTGTASTVGSTARGPNYSDTNQRLQSNRILRCIERIILVGGALDTEALVLVPGKWVWRFTVALTVLDDGGNVIDACTLAAITALRHYRKPKVNLSGGVEQESSLGSEALPVMIPSTVQEATPLPLHHTPLSITFALIAAGEENATASNSPVTTLVDPTDREELAQVGSFTVATNIHSEVCLLDFGGGCEVLPRQLRECWAVGATVAQQLCETMETALQQADDKARQERLTLLQGRENSKIDNPHKLVPPAKSPYFLQVEGTNEFLGVEAEADSGHIKDAQKEAEELYRKHALDYTTGHVASTVKEDVTTEEPRVGGKNDGSLIAAMLQSVGRDHVPGTLYESNNNPGVSDSMNHLRGPHEHVGAVETDPRESLKHDGSRAIVTESLLHGRSAATSTADAEDEEDAVVLCSEFGMSLQDDSTKKQEVLGTSVAPGDNQNVSDLSMAIKKKRKKKKKQ